MTRLILLVLLPLAMLRCASSDAQNPFPGRYTGTLQGDAIVLHLEPDGPGKLKGSMQDSQQSYAIEATSQGKTISGTASLAAYNLVLDFKGTLSGNNLPLTMEVRGLGSGAFNVNLTKESAAGTSTAGTKAADPKGKTGTGGTGAKGSDGRQRDPEVVGTWVKEEIYNSGYGDNYMGSTMTQSMTFAADGRLIDGGSSATMGGGNYHGESSSQGNGEVPDVRWYTRNREIWLVVTQNGQTQELKLGRYAFGGGAMRITSDNGQKLLLRRG
jgi:hypothetical protein